MSINIEEQYADKSLYFKIKNIRIDKYFFRTPIKATVPSKYIDIKSIYEMYRRLDANNIRKMWEDSNIISSFQHKVKSKSLRYLPEDALPIFFIEYKTPKIPSDKELELMFRIQEPIFYSRFYVIPILGGFKKLDNLGDDLVNYYKRAVELLESFTPKPIMISIRIDFSLAQIKLLLNSVDMDALCIDFRNRVPTSTILQMAHINHYLREKEHEILLYSINLRAGLKNKESDVIPAKDILSYALGIDVLGKYHLRPPGIRDFGNKPAPPRMFYRKDYGYYYVHSPEIVERIYDRESRIPIEFLMKGSPDVYKFYNDESIQREMEYVKKRIDEGTDAYDVFSSKGNIQKQIKNIAQRKRKGIPETLEKYILGG